MSASLLTYVWHYLVARTLYDELLRPVLDGNLAAILLIACVGAAAFLVGRWTHRRAKRGRA